jgi:hypothetical protein
MLPEFKINIYSLLVNWFYEYFSKIVSVNNKINWVFDFFCTTRDRVQHQTGGMAFSDKTKYGPIFLETFPQICDCIPSEDLTPLVL